MGDVSPVDPGAGCLVHERLADRTFPEGVELVDAGDPGLDFSAAVRESGRVVFVDTVSGRCKPGEMVLIRDRDQVLEHFGHPGKKAGPVDLSVLPGLLYSEDGPEAILVGLEAPASDVSIWRAAEKSLMLAEQLDHSLEPEKPQPWFTSGADPAGSHLNPA
jgi:hydrogenase maturation protease